MAAAPRPPKFVLYYDVDDEALEKAPAHYEAHLARIAEFHARGDLLMVGLLVDPTDAAMSVWRSREAIDEFMAGDPFVVHGVVRTWHIHQWDESLV